MVTPEDCALRVVSTVVARPDSCHAIIDAGVKALTSDLACFGTGYGYIIGHPEIIIYKLNEEHGFLKSDEPINFEIGEKIAIIRITPVLCQTLWTKCMVSVTGSLTI